jgi:Zn-dependent protease with chaperone function
MEKTKSLSRVLQVSEAIQGISRTSYKIDIVQSIDNDPMQAQANRERNNIELTSKLVDSMDDDELAFVIAHEIAHYVDDDKHRIEKISEEYHEKLMGALHETNAKLKERGHGFLYRALCGIGLTALGVGGAYVVIRQAGQMHETEADELALQYMQQAGYDAHKAVSALRILHGGDLPDLDFWDSIILSVTSTHPLPIRREDDIKRKLRQE